jgi:hypothetical protein
MQALLVSLFGHLYLLRQVLALQCFSNKVAASSRSASFAMQRFAVIGPPEEILIWNYWPIGHKVLVLLESGRFAWRPAH